MSRVVVPISFVTFVIVGLQLSILSQLRISGVVVMLVWLWPLVLGLAGYSTVALYAGLLAGVFFDTHASTPFGLTALTGVVLAYGFFRLGREGVGDLDSAAWWVTPLLAAAGGFVAPLFYVISGAIALNFSLWRGSVLAMMVVNACSFFLLSRPMTRLALFVAGPDLRVRR